ncbi:hypothetical protein [Telluribacter humicola]|uniref:hypothetical protein n=1 Tax=Telluribacter humicola TaxID=1720261 RepID=UPI001A9713B9|nr:hypothetical protein [Telluribacter humicola]
MELREENNQHYNTPANTVKSTKAEPERGLEPSPKIKSNSDLPWIQRAPHAPYFITDLGEDWSPIGQNDAITWPDFANLFRRKDLKQVEGHLAWLAEHNVTCLRFMLEYSHTEHRYFERPAGTFAPNMVRL